MYLITSIFTHFVSVLPISSMYIDPGIIQGCIKQDRKAQAAFYKACYPTMMSVCKRYAKEESEAALLLNTAFMKVITKLDSRAQNAPLEAWIRRVTINTAIDHFRQHQRRQSHVSYVDMDDHAAGNLAVDFNEADRQFDAEAILVLVRQLPTATQHVFNLFAIDGFSHKEIGEHLGISEGTSKWHVSHARKTIQAALIEAEQRISI